MVFIYLDVVIQLYAYINVIYIYALYPMMLFLKNFFPKKWGGGTYSKTLHKEAIHCKYKLAVKETNISNTRILSKRATYQKRI